MTDSLTNHLQQSARGSLILLIGQICSTLITAIAIVIVARFLGSTSYGQVTIAMIPLSFASMFTDPGVNTGLIKYISQYRAEKKTGDLKTLLTTGLLINTIASLFFVFVLNFSSGYLATEVFNQPEVKLLIQVASINLLAQALVNASRSIFIGFERMKFVSLLTIIQSVLKSVLAPLLVYLGLGALGAVIGNTISIVVAGAVGAFFVITAVVMKFSFQQSSISRFEASRILLAYGFPLFLSLLVGGAISQIYNFLMAIYIDPFSIGNYQAATNFSVLIHFFIMPISTVLFPLFSKIDSHENNRLGMIYQNAVKYAGLITVPMTSALILLSSPIVQIIYGNSYPMTAQYLQLYCIDFFFIGVGVNCTGSLLNGQGMTRPIFIGSLINLFTVLSTGFYLIPKYGIPGLIFTMILATKGGFLYYLWQIKKNLGFTIDWRTSIKIYISSAIPFVMVYYLLKALNLDEWVSLIIGGSLYVILFLLFTIYMRIVDTQDIQNLKRILSSMGPFTPFFNMFLTFFEKYVR